MTPTMVNRSSPSVTAPAEDVRRAAVAACPQRVAHHEHSLRSFHVVGSRQRAPENGLDAKHFEKAAGHRGAVDVAWVPSSLMTSGPRVGIHSPRRPRATGWRSDGVNLRPAKGMMGESRGSKLLPGDDEPLFVANGHRPQQHALTIANITVVPVKPRPRINTAAPLKALARHSPRQARPMSRSRFSRIMPASERCQSRRVGESRDALIVVSMPEIHAVRMPSCCFPK